MNLHQFHLVREAVRQNFNLTEAAKALFTSQPGVSKAIIELEEELGIDIFSRHGKRIRGLTEPGRQVLKSVELILQEIEGLKRIGKEFAAQDMGSLTIATTHTQARYSLPTVVQAFAHKFPKVRLSLLQGNPKQVAEMVLNGQADLAIATEAIAEIDGVPADRPTIHPLLLLAALGLLAACWRLGTLLLRRLLSSDRLVKNIRTFCRWSASLLGLLRHVCGSCL